MELTTGSKVFLLFLLVAGLLIAGAVTSLGDGEEAATGEAVIVEIPEGASARTVAEILDERGVIDATTFRVRARFDERSGRIRPGQFELTTGATADEILGVLTAAPPPAPAFTVTVPEGLIVDEVLQRVADAEDSPFTVDELRAALPAVPLPDWVPLPEALPPESPYELTRYEGLLFPETYEFRQDADPVAVLTRLVEQTDAVLEGILGPVGDPAAGGPQRRYDVLVRGSLIEREARVADERPVISSVIENRLVDGMRLQVDATVLYATSQVGENRVLFEDLEAQSPWNTYVVGGLPPTPISNAGESALRAAAQPADTAYRFYVVSDPATGEHAFAETLAEHNRNVAQYRDAREDNG